MIELWLLVGYLVSGIVFAAWFDRREMKEHVPYRDEPAILPLRTIRAIYFLKLVLGGPILAIVGFSLAFVKLGKWYFRILRYARYKNANR